MKYYIEFKVSDYNNIAEKLMLIHLSGIEFSYYFDLRRTLRFFSNDIKLNQFADIKETPRSSVFVKCCRVRAIERRSPRQQEKRIKRLKEHLNKKGIEYVSEHRKNDAAADYYLNVYSYSSARFFRLNIKNTVCGKKNDYKYSSYGLSVDGSNVPLF